MIDSLMFDIPVNDNVSVMKLSTGFLECYLSKWIFMAKTLMFKDMKSSGDLTAHHLNARRITINLYSVKL